MNHMIDCDPGDSPMSPYYKENPADNPRVTCSFCWYDFDVNVIVIDANGDKACPECKEYNDSINK